MTPRPLLLDTHVFLWLQSDPERLGPALLGRLGDQVTPLMLSAASAWEIAIKHALGKLPLPAPAEAYVPARMQASSIDGLAISHAHALAAGSLPRHHRDPFDRLLVAQSMLEGFPVVTADPIFAAYGVEVVVVPAP